MNPRRTLAALTTIALTTAGTVATVHAATPAKKPGPVLIEGAVWCRNSGPIEVMIDWDGIRPNRRPYVKQVIDTALGQYADVTGLTFVDGPNVEMTVTPGFSIVVPEGTPMRRIAFAFTPDLGKVGTVGFGGSSITDNGSGTWIYSTGTVIASAPLLNSGMARDRALELMLHELGHVFGLDHTKQGLMAPIQNGNTSLDKQTITTLASTVVDCPTGEE